MNPANTVLVKDNDRCQGHGRCYSLAPAVIDSDDLGYAVLKEGSIPPDLAEQARLAVSSCPEQALELVSETEPQLRETSRD